MKMQGGRWSKTQHIAKASMLSALVVAACADPDDIGADAEDSGGLVSIGGMDTDGSSTGGGDDVEGDDTDGTKLDVNVGDTGIETMGCTKVDFLFVVDNSVSMEGEQAALVAAFPGFMETISNTLEVGSDHHVMVVDTDEWGRCDTADGWEGSSPQHGTCTEYIRSTAFGECDRVLGAGVVHPAGALASNQPCVPDDASRYLDETSPDLSETFACMATVGTAGHPSERPMDALVAALQPEINGPGGCNEGFLRDDALLVVTFISDDPNYEDAGDPTVWYDAVVDAKHGDPSAVVVLGMTPAWDGCQDGKGPPKGEHWAEFVSMWGDTGLHGNVCGTAEEYVDFFQQAVDSIDQACDQYEPPG